MAPLISYTSFALAIISFFAFTTVCNQHAGQRVPLGGALFSLESHRILERQDNDLGNDCGGDPACVTADFGCGCDYQDGSWMDPQIGPAPPATPTSSALFPANASPTCIHTAGYGCDCSDGSHPAEDEDGRCCLGNQCFNANTDPGAAPPPAPPPAAPPGPPAPSPSITCKLNGNVCECSDGSHPIQDEDGRCCVSEDSTGHNTQCFN